MGQGRAHTHAGSMTSMRRITAYALVGALVSACAVGAGDVPAGKTSQTQAVTPVAPQASLPARAVIATNHELPEALPLQSVYFVVATSQNASGRAEGYSRGVAFSYERDGSDCVLVTAAHVVQGAGEINVHVLMPDLTSGTGYSARIKWIDAAKDIAALRIRGSAACNPVRRYGEGIPIGRRITAFLNTPLARGMITGGMVGGYWMTEVGPTIICDMQVYPGHSGSPLLDVHGRLVGMVLSRTKSPEMSAAFALPTSAIEAAFAAGNAPASKPVPATTESPNENPPSHF